MRLSRNTLLLLLVSVIVILAVLLLSQGEGEEEAVATPVVQEEGGPLLPALSEADIVSVALRDNQSGSAIQLTRAEDVWALSGPADAAQRTVDQSAAQETVADLLQLAASSSFEIDDTSAFGLDAPAWTLEIDRGEGPLEIVFVGNQNPQGTRYYVMQRQLDAVASAPDLEQGKQVLLVNSRPLDAVLDRIDDPPWEALPTATPLPTATLNPLSEVEIATATAVAQATATAETGAVLATVTAQAALTPTPEAAG